MAAELRISPIYHDQDILEVRLAIDNGSFRATADLYLGRDTLSEFAAQLKGFPAHSEEARTITLGAFGANFAGGGASLEFFCRDQAGHATLRATVKEDHRSHGTQSAIVVAAFEPAALDAFLIQIRHIGDELKGSATLSLASL